MGTIFIMKTDTKDLLELLTKVQEEQGDLTLILVIGLIIIIGILIVYLKFYIKTDIEEASKKNIADFENKLTGKLQTQMGLFFTNENLRTNLITHIGTKSVDTKIECWQLIHKMYFKYQKSWSFDSNTEFGEMVKLDKNLEDIRIKIFNETIYLGYELSARMIRLNSLMRNNLRNKRLEIKYEQREQMQQLQKISDEQINIESKISDLIYEIEEFLIKKLHSDQTIEKFEFNEDELEIIKEERKRKFDKIKEQ